MKRREFIALVSGAAAGWPLAAQGQQGSLPLVVFLQRTAPIRNDFEHFRSGLLALGYEHGRNIQIDQRYAESNDERLRELALEATKLKPAVIVVDGSVTAAAVQAATATIPMVMTIMSDPERFGITNLAKPGSNITGLSTLTDVLYAKRVELLKEMLPTIRRIAVLRPLPNVSAIGTRVVSEAARSLGLDLRTYDAGAPNTWPMLFAAMKHDKCDALLQFIDGRFANRTTELVILAAAHRLPAVYAEREFVDVGGLASYGISLADQWRRAAGYVDKILKGSRPGDLPVQQPTRFELVINMRTARALGVAMPPVLLARADEVIE